MRYFSDMHGTELSAHFTLWRYTFSQCQQADIDSIHYWLNFETTFILSNDGYIFDLKNRVHTPDYLESSSSEPHSFHSRHSASVWCKYIWSLLNGKS